MQRKKSIVLALLAVVMTVGALWFTSRAVTPKEATWEDVLAEAGAGGYKIITTEDLAKAYRKDSSALLLVDTRQEWEYRTGHMKGALNFPMEPTWWSRWRKAGALESFLGQDRERTIVFY
jgi:3-mercaptopyruvate sulfurtransferase SseA